MKYQIFDDLKDGLLTRGEHESEQEFMERVLKSAAEENHAQECIGINQMIAPEFAGCSYEDMTLSFQFHVHEWSLNPSRTLHGGVIATACDITMGVLARFYCGGVRAVTVELNVSYMRPIGPDEDYVVEARMKKNGKRLKFTECKVLRVTDEEVIADASGVFL